MRDRTTPLGLTAIVVLAAACSSEDPDPRSTTQIDTLPNGSVWVRNGSLDPVDDPRWRIESEVRIGAVDGDGPDLFGAVRAVDQLPDGRIMVLEHQSQELRIFRPDGTHDRTFGGHGEGPGELSGANGFLVGPDGLIRVNDSQNARLSFFHPDSGFVRSVPMEVQLWGFVWGAAIGPAGRIYERTLAGDFDDRWWVIRVFDERGAWADTIRLEQFVFDINDEPPGSYRYDRGMSSVPFWPQSREVIDGRGFRWRGTADVNEYRITQTTFEGDTVLTFESARTPLPVPAEARDSAIDVLRERAGEELDWSRIPTEMPIVEGIMLDDQGRVWVRVNASDSLTVFDVYGRDGVYQGSAVTDITPPTYPVPSVVGDVMVAMVTDELGIPYVVRGRVREVR